MITVWAGISVSPEGTAPCVGFVPSSLQTPAQKLITLLIFSFDTNATWSEDSSTDSDYSNLIFRRHQLSQMPVDARTVLICFWRKCLSGWGFCAVLCGPRCDWVDASQRVRSKPHFVYFASNLRCTCVSISNEKSIRIFTVLGFPMKNYSMY